MKKLIGIATGDWHIHNWKQFNKGGLRLKQNLKMIKDFVILSDSNKVPIFYTGDLLHTPDSISNKLLDGITITFKNLFDEYPNAKLYGISGNHDQSESNTVENRSPSYINSLSRIIPSIRCIDFKSFSPKGMRPIVLHGIPYLDHNRDFEKALEKLTIWPDTKNILLIHTNLYGASDPSGYEMEVENIPKNLGKFFKPFDLVLSGHIHKFTEVWPNKVYMVGAPNQQRKSDMSCRMGYLEVYDDLTVKFKKTEYPEFKEYEEGDNIDDFHFWVKKIKNDSKDKIKNENFNNDMSRVEIVDRYLKIKGIDSNIKRNILLKLLNSVE